MILAHSFKMTKFGLLRVHTSVTCAASAFLHADIAAAAAPNLMEISSGAETCR